MFYRTLKPIRDRLKYSDDLSKIISRDLFYLIYKPLIDLLTPAARHGARPSVLLQAFLSRTIYYTDGYVYGKFNASISKALREIGGTFNKTKKAFKVDMARIPIDIKSAIAQGNMAEQQSIDRMRAKAEKLAAQSIVIPAVQEIADTTLDDLHKQFEQLTPEDLQIPVEMNAEMEKKVRQDYTESVHLNINNLSQEMTERLRYRVEEAVGQGMRAKDLKEILMAEYGIAANRAKFIARQDTSLFVAKYREVRYSDAGIKLYQWSSSADVKVRPRHRELNGRIFSFDDPPVVDELTNRRGNPGEDFNCVPADSNIDLAYGIRKCFRRWYTGKLTTVVTDSGKTIRATPNHQVLTSQGWKAIGMLNSSDYIIDLGEELMKSTEGNINSGVSFIGDVFESFSKIFGMVSCNDTAKNFHGDGSDSEVNIVCTAGCLRLWIKTFFNQFINNFFFSFSNTFTLCFSQFIQRIFSPINIFFRILSNFSYSFSGSMSNNAFFFKRSIFESQNISFRAIADSDTITDKTIGNDDSFNACSFRNRQKTFSGKICFNNWFNIYFKDRRWSSFPSIGINAHFSKPFRNIISMKADNLSGFLKSFTGIHKLDRVAQCSNRDFSGHVYNLETLNNWFMIDGLLYHNCRCVAIPVVLTSGKTSNRPKVKYEIEGTNLLETQEHKAIYR